MEKYILAIDQGTTSTRAVLFDKKGNKKAFSQKEIPVYYKKPGWVEQDANEIWISVMYVVVDLITSNDIKPESIEAIGITNQRETTVVWDKNTGIPIYHAIVWQSAQSADICHQWQDAGYEKTILEKTGLRLNPYFSASKIRWILEHVEGAREKAERGELIFGTMDSWLLYRMTGEHIHVTDYSNASRTMLYNIYTLEWDQELLEMFQIPRAMLPEVNNSSQIYGYTAPFHFFGLEIPIAGIAGDQQAALFGQKCFEQGMMKNTYGTGCFMLMNTGNRPMQSKHNMLTTIAWGINGEVEYALEGSVFSAGSAIQWLRDELQLIQSAQESEKLSEALEDNGGVYMVPAFSGMGAPYWNDAMKCAMVGITRGTTKAHIVRAALEAIAYQTKDVLEAMREDSGLEVKTLRVDGGASANNFLLQFQSDILDVNVERAVSVEATALGAAFLAGLAVGFWKDKKELSNLDFMDHVFYPKMNQMERESLYKHWKKAVEATEGYC